MNIEELKQAFADVYHRQAEKAFFAPGRVNLIGEHTDYNGGHVFPCALSFGTYLLVAPNDKGRLRFKSLNADETVELPLDRLSAPLEKGLWVNYPLGCIAQFVRQGFPLRQGYDLLFWGNVPAGAGLSSSAAIEVVTAFAFNDILAARCDKTRLAQIGQQSEHEFAGVNCGIMDQFASAYGKKDHAIYLDCGSLQFEYVPLRMDGIKLVVANTHSPHKLDSGAYNDRVAQCQLAVRQLRSVCPALQNLAELSARQFEQVKGAINDPIALKRATHVVAECQRTVDAVGALKAGDIELFGQLMNQSHASLRDNYEVTGPYLDALAEEAWKVPGVLGSRMTGGGFGGCTVSLVREEAVPLFIEKVGSSYKARTAIDPDFYVAEIGDGARAIEL